MNVVGVVGAGTMGNGIAQVAARAGYNVIMHDVRDEFLDRGLKVRSIRACNATSIRSGSTRRKASDHRSRIRTTTDLRRLKKRRLSSKQ
jgi:3-hydroxybutyryl-CoA dehydrogenase